MNYWHTKMMAEKHREEIAEEMQQIRLEQQALSVRRPGWVGRRMFSLGNWMVAAGENLRRRYERREDCLDCPPALYPTS